ncbi:MAG: hypothetical protein JWM14_1076 [Chitinophagaceae bacterium]|nr:hypothetical protein [Chitinophagaceae bacterium]
MAALLSFGLIRIASGSIEELEKLKVDEKLVNNVHQIYEQFERFKNNLNDILYQAIEQESDPGVQKKLLNIKRAVYNGKSISLDELPLSPALSKELDTYLSFKKKTKELEDQTALEYNKQLLLIRKKYQQLLDNELLKKGLLLSSTDLILGIDKYRSKDLEKVSAKEIQTEYGSMRYLTRMLTKTSPFSTFNGLSMFDLKDSLVNWQHKKYLKIGSSHIKLNLQLFKCIKNALWKDVQFMACLPVHLTKALHTTDLEFTLLQNRNGLDIVQTLKSNDVVYFLRETFQEDDSIPYSHLLKLLGEQIDASETALKEYIEKLTSIGLIVYDFPVDLTIKNWEKDLLNYISKPEFASYPKQHLLKSSLEKINVAVIRFGLSNFNERAAILASIKEEFIQLISSLEEGHDSKPLTERVTTLPQVNFIYEDYEVSIDSGFPKDEVETIIQSLNNLILSISPVLKNTTMLTSLYEYFKYKYPDQTRISFIPFFKEYIESVKLPNESNKNQHDDGLRNFLFSNGITIESADQKIGPDQWIYEFGTYFSDALNPDQVEFTTNEIDEYHRHIGIAPVVSNGNFSFSSFAQPCAGDQDQLVLMINSVMPGNGKMFSRFLHMFDEHYLQEIRNKNHEENPYTAEISDSSYFNANIHPLLSDCEIWTDNANALTQDRQKKLFLGDMEVVLNEKERSIYLYHKILGQTICVLDGGFEGAFTRSNLYFFLNNFKPDELTYVDLITQAVNNKLGYDYALRNNKDEILILPRIQINKHLVLQRKCWVIPLQSIPLRESTDSDWSYFYRINNWRIQHSIEEDVFLRKNSNRIQMIAQIKERDKEFVKEDYKPQYINFLNPLLVNIFEKSIRNTKAEKIKLEEVYPKKDQLLTIDGNPHVTETLLQWTI